MDIPEGAKRWRATEKPERYAAEGFAEGAECRRTTEKPVILGGRQVTLRCHGLPPFCITAKREIEKMAQYMKYTKQQAISVVITCAKKYRDELEDKSLLFICQDKHKNLSYQEVSFYARNFLHLTGLKVKRGNPADEMTARNFYSKCLSRKLSPNDFDFSDDGTTFMKLDVLPALMTKNLSAQMIGDYNLSKPKLYTEKLAGNIKACMGFRVDDMTGDFVPDTVLNEDVRDMTTKCVRVIATYRKGIGEKHYEELTYKAKGIDLAALRYPEEVRALLGENESSAPQS